MPEALAQAIRASPLKLTRLYNKMAEMMPGFHNYCKKDTRKVPVFELIPVK